LTKKGWSNCVFGRGVFSPRPGVPKWGLGDIVPDLRGLGSKTPAGGHSQFRVFLWAEATLLPLSSPCTRTPFLRLPSLNTARIDAVLVEAGGFFVENPPPLGKMAPKNPKKTKTKKTPKNRGEKKPKPKNVLFHEILVIEVPTPQRFFYDVFPLGGLFSPGLVG